MERPRRIITIHLPHRETVVPAVLVFLLVAASVAGMLSPYFAGPSGPEEELPPVTIPDAQLASPAVNDRVEALLKKMTLEEKIGQLTQYSAGAMTGPGSDLGDLEDLIAQGQVGSLFNVVGAGATETATLVLDASGW